MPMGRAAGVKKRRKKRDGKRNMNRERIEETSVGFSLFYKGLMKSLCLYKIGI